MDGARVARGAVVTPTEQMIPVRDAANLLLLGLALGWLGGLAFAALSDWLVEAARRSRRP